MFAPKGFTGATRRTARVPLQTWNRLCDHAHARSGTPTSPGYAGAWVADMPQSDAVMRVVLLKENVWPCNTYEGVTWRDRKARDLTLNAPSADVPAGATDEEIEEYKPDYRPSMPDENCQEDYDLLVTNPWMDTYYTEGERAMCWLTRNSGYILMPVPKLFKVVCSAPVAGEDEDEDEDEESVLSESSVYESESGDEVPAKERVYLVKYVGTGTGRYMYIWNHPDRHDRMEQKVIDPAGLFGQYYDFAGHTISPGHVVTFVCVARMGEAGDRVFYEPIQVNC